MNRSRVSYRETILNSTRLIVAFCLVSLAAGSKAGAAEISQKCRDGQRFKIGACDWTLGKQSDLASVEIAKRVALDGVQIDFGNIKNNMHLRKPEVQKAFLDAAKKNNVKIASIAIDYLNLVPYKSDPRAQQWVLDCIDVCKAMNVKIILLPFFARGYLLNKDNSLDTKGIDTVVKRLKEAAPKAEKAGVILALETYLSAPQTMDIINRVGSPAVQVYYDVGNSHFKGYDIYQEIRYLGKKNICEFHAKDYDNLLGKGKIDFKKVRQAIDDIGYRGWIVIEASTKPLGVEGSCRANTEYLRSIFGAKKIYLIDDNFSAWTVGGTKANNWQSAKEVFMNPLTNKEFLIQPGSGIFVNGQKGRAVYLESKEHFGDLKAHFEFMIPKGSNSGIYFMGRYELQIYDSWEKKAEYAGIECGGIYRGKGYEGKSPMVNASRKPGEWQSFDVIFRAPRFDKAGKKIDDAKFERVSHNGQIIHENAKVTGPTHGLRKWEQKAEESKGPILIQGDHGPVAYRNIWVIPLD